MALTSPSYVCESDVVPAANYPRTMLADASLSFALAAIQDVRVGISTSINNGPYSFGSPIILRNGAGQHLLQYFSTQQAVDAGSSYKYAIRVDRASSSAVPLGAWACHLQVEIVNAFGSQ
jgi:hypothetical protein